MRATIEVLDGQKCEFEFCYDWNGAIAWRIHSVDDDELNAEQNILMELITDHKEYRRIENLMAQILIEDAKIDKYNDGEYGQA